VANYITDANHLPEDGYCRPKHVGEVPYVYGEVPYVYGEVPYVYGEVPYVYGEVPYVYGEVPYVYKTAVLLLLCSCWHNMPVLCLATEHFTLDIISL